MILWLEDIISCERYVVDMGRNKALRIAMASKKDLMVCVGWGMEFTGMRFLIDTV